MPDLTPPDQPQLLQQMAHALKDMDVSRVHELTPQINWGRINALNIVSSETGYTAPPLDEIYRAFAGHSSSSAEAAQNAITRRPFVTQCILQWIDNGYNPVCDEHFFHLLRSSRVDDVFIEQTTRAIDQKGLTDNGVGYLNRLADQLVASRQPIDHVILSCLKNGSDPNATNDAGVPVLLAVLRKVGSPSDTAQWDVKSPIRAARMLLDHGVDVYAPDTSTDIYLSASNPFPPRLRPTSTVLDTAIQWMLNASLVADKDPDALALLQSLLDLHTRTVIQDVVADRTNQTAARAPMKM